MNENTFGLPRQLDDGLLLRWATAADNKEIADFNVRVHSNDIENPAEFLRHWTNDLISDYHPTCSPADFTVVVDENDGGKIVSSMNLISQTWSYDGIPFAVGRPELVGTDPDYRRRRLVRYQFDAIHAKSEARGEFVQAITGIPWFYRQFGYEMCVNLGGSRHYYWEKQKPVADYHEETYTLRDATEADLPVLDELYGRFCQTSPLSRPRDNAQWHYELFTANRESPYCRNVKMVENQSRQVVGYFEFAQWRAFMAVREIAVQEGQSLREIALFICRALKAEADKRNEDREEPINRIHFELGEAHPLYEALDWELDKLIPPYSWYMRVADLPAFLLQIAPALDKRLAKSVMAGFSGTKKVGFYSSAIEITWENGRLQQVQPYPLKTREEGDLNFPDHTFLQLLFCHRSLSELDRMFADCYAKDGDSFVLFNALFPKRPSLLVPLG